MIEVLFARGVSIALAVAVAVVPLYLPRRSRYYKNALEGINTLSRFTETEIVRDRSDGGETGMDTSGKVEISWLSKSNKGFKEVKKTIQGIGGERTRIWYEDKTGEIQRIGFLKAPSTTVIAGYFNREDLVYGAGPNYVLFLQYEDEQKGLVSYDPNRPQYTQNHDQLRSWVLRTSERRSHFITSLLALLWSSTSIWLITFS